MNIHSLRRAKGAIVVIELEDGAVIVAEMPRPHNASVSIRYDDEDPMDWLAHRLRPPRHEMDISISGSPGGAYTYITREGVADWFARRNAEPWPDTPGLDTGPLAIESGA